MSDLDQQDASEMSSVFEEVSVCVVPRERDHVIWMEESENETKR